MEEINDDIKNKIMIDVLLNAQIHNGSPNAKVVLHTKCACLSN